MSQLLARHPQAHETESLLGYVIRLTEVNGYASPRDLYRLAGMTSGETAATSFNFSKLAAITTQPVSLLERLAIRTSQSQSQAVYLLGNIVSKSYLDLIVSKACPDCVAEKGFIEAHWHLNFMVACPVHTRAAVFYCPKCKHYLGWMRPGLLTCRCGESFQPPSKAIFLEPELRLLDIIRRKALGDQTLNEDTCMPERQLAHLDLQSALSLVSFLGKNRMIASWSKGEPKARPILQAAAKVLADWPSGFHRLLGDIFPGQSSKAFQVEDFADVYRVVGERMTARFGRTADNLIDAS